LEEALAAESDPLKKAELQIEIGSADVVVLWETRLSSLFGGKSWGQSTRIEGT
jgi:hypothetical protein